jgi:uncharacterized protein (TIGR02147 family)
MNFTSTWFSDEYVRRKGSNPQYSIRAFARDLGLGKSTVWEAVAGKRVPSHANLLQVARRLTLSPEETLRLMQALGYREGQNRPDPIPSDRQLSEDQFHLIADWHYLAILNLASCTDNSADPVYIGKRLNLLPTQVKSAIERLERLGLLTIENNRLVRVSQWIETTRDVPSAAIRRHHRQMLDLAGQSLERDPIEKRHFESLTLALNPSVLPKIKLLIKKFGDEAAKASSLGQKEEVYGLTVQLFPVSHEIKS